MPNNSLLEVIRGIVAVYKPLFAVTVVAVFIGRMLIDHHIHMTHDYHFLVRWYVTKAFFLIMILRNLVL